VVKFGSKLLSTGSLPLLALAPVGALSAHIETQSSTQYLYEFVSGDPGTHAHNWRYAAEFLYDSPTDLDDAVDFPGKADFFR